MMMRVKSEPENRFDDIILDFFFQTECTLLIDRHHRSFIPPYWKIFMTIYWNAFCPINFYRIRTMQAKRSGKRIERGKYSQFARYVCNWWHSIRRRHKPFNKKSNKIKKQKSRMHSIVKFEVSSIITNSKEFQNVSHLLGCTEASTNNIAVYCIHFA